jgi:hypothetical protein
MSNVVTVACNLPRGMICELGLVLDRATSRFIKTPAYRQVRLKGSQTATLIALPKGSQYVSQRGLPPGLTEGVDREFIETWLKAHPRLAQHVWIVESRKDVPHQVGDRDTPPFEPLDTTKPFKVGLDEVTTADFHRP